MRLVVETVGGRAGTRAASGPGATSQEVAACSWPRIAPAGTAAVWTFT